VVNFGLNELREGTSELGKGTSELGKGTSELGKRIYDPGKGNLDKPSRRCKAHHANPTGRAQAKFA
jgi:hypothetical protein